MTDESFHAAGQEKASVSGVQPCTPQSFRNSSNSLVSRCRSGLSRRKLSISVSAFSHASGCTSRLEKSLRKLRSTSDSVSKLSPFHQKTGRLDIKNTVDIVPTNSQASSSSECLRAPLTSVILCLSRDIARRHGPLSCQFLPIAGLAVKPRNRAYLEDEPGRRPGDRLNGRIHDRQVG